MSRAESERLADIVAAIDRCLSYRDHLDDPNLASMAYDAILRNLAVIGEAVKALPSTFKDDKTDVPWPAIAGLRNVVVHEYFRIHPDLIRDILDNSLTTLRSAITT